MNRRDLLGTLSMAGGASMVGSAQPLADALAPGPSRFRPGGGGHRAGQDPRNQDDLTAPIGSGWSS